MPICNTAAMNHHLARCSQVAADAHAVVILDGASWHNSHGLWYQQYHVVSAAAYSRAQSSGAGLHYLRSHWLANSVFRSGPI